jgi:hypothetical protein
VQAHQDAGDGRGGMVHVDMPAPILAAGPTRGDGVGRRRLDGHVPEMVVAAGGGPEMVVAAGGMPEMVVAAAGPF